MKKESIKYFLLKKDVNDKGIIIKINRKIEKITSKMAILVNQHAILDRQLIQELANLNNTSEDEISDIISSYDFLVDESQYGLSNFSNEQISKEEYLKLRTINEY